MVRQLLQDIYLSKITTPGVRFTQAQGKSKVSQNTQCQKLHSNTFIHLRQSHPQHFPEINQKNIIGISEKKLPGSDNYQQ